MATMTLSLSDDMKEWIEDRVDESEFETPEEFLGDVLTRERARSDEQRIAELRRIVDESLASGVSTKTMADIIDEGNRIAKERGLL